MFRTERIVSAPRSAFVIVETYLDSNMDLSSIKHGN